MRLSFHLFFLMSDAGRNNKPTRYKTTFQAFGGKMSFQTLFIYIYMCMYIHIIYDKSVLDRTLKKRDVSNHAVMEICAVWLK